MKTFRLFVAFTLVSLALSAGVHAVVPAPDGGYPNFTTAEGQNALKNLTTGPGNTAVGWYSLFSNTDGSFNTAVGAGTLVLNIGNQAANEGVENTAVGTGALLLNVTGSFYKTVGFKGRFKQCHWPRQHGGWRRRAAQQHHRRLQHGNRRWGTLEQHDRR